MKSIFTEIKRLRGNDCLCIDRNNNNRNRVIVDEIDGTKTAYYFSAPIYNIHSKKIVDFKFNPIGSEFVLEGSNTKTVIGEDVSIIGTDGSCKIRMNGKMLAKSDQEIRYDRYTLLPTTNGIAYQVTIDNEQTITFELEVTIPFLNIRANDKYFALMKEKFLPFATVSCIGTMNEKNQVIAPAVIDYQKINDKKYCISISSCSSIGSGVLFEVNMYEPKLFQDTTVESKKPLTNNAFGSTAFLGETEQFGEQWLYIRLLFLSSSELVEQRQNRVQLHLPAYYRKNKKTIDLFMIVSRFCSFGSNWDNKIAYSNWLARGTYDNGYLSFDITDFVAMLQEKYFVRSDGMLLKPTEKGNGAAVIATGDSYLNLPIVEINYK